MRCLTRAEALRDLGRAAEGHPGVREALAIIEILAPDDPHLAAGWLARANGLLPND